jgi:hypothetical protein
MAVMERGWAFRDNRFEPGGSQKAWRPVRPEKGDPVSDLFGCVPPEAFRIFTGLHASAAEAALLRLCATHFGEMALENPERDQVKNAIEAAIEGMPTPPAAANELGDEPEMASSDYLYLKMREGGWLVEESDRWLIRVSMPEGHRRLMTVLRDLKENIAKSFTGLVSQVSSLIDAAADNPMMHATNIDAAWQTAVGFRRHMAGIDAALVSVTRRLNASEGMDDSVDVFFAEFVDRILIRDWTKILSTNNPWRSRHHVTRSVREILGSAEAMEKAVAAYVEAGHAGTAGEGEALIRKRLAEISTSFDDIERLRLRIDQGQVGIEGRIRDILRFIGRNPATIRERVEACLAELALLDDHVELPCVLPLLNCLEPIGESRFPEAREPLPPPEARVLRRPPEDPYRRRFVQDCRAFDLASEPTARHALTYLESRGGGDAVSLAPESGKDWFTWRHIALLALTGRGRRLNGWLLGPAEGVAVCRYGEIPNFMAIRITETPQ